jgi:hypothetical protein
VLEAVQPIDPVECPTCVVRGQYGRGTAGGVPVPGYREEPYVDPHSLTETFVALKIVVDNWRWAGVPFYMRTGKRLRARKTEIMIQFRNAPLALFRHSGLSLPQPNSLVVGIQPQESISLVFQGKVPGPAIETSTVDMHFDYRRYFGMQNRTGYETLLYDAIIGDSTLFARGRSKPDGLRSSRSCGRGVGARRRLHSTSPAAKDPIPAGCLPGRPTATAGPLNPWQPYAPACVERRTTARRAGAGSALDWDTPRMIWRQLDQALECTRNPWLILQCVATDQLHRLLVEPRFREKVQALLEAKRVLETSAAWFQKAHPESTLTAVAYFSMEYMLSEALPIYAGGLGNVAGDQLKAASDLNVPVI